MCCRIKANHAPIFKDLTDCILSLVLDAVISHNSTKQPRPFYVGLHSKAHCGLEYSVVDALASVHVSSICIADDKGKTRIIKQIQDVIND